MDDRNREKEIADLRQQLSTLQAERRTLAYDCIRLADWVQEVRKEFGNPFYYSHPTVPDKGIGNYTGNRSHEISSSLTDSRMPTLSDFNRVERESARIKEELRRLGA